MIHRNRTHRLILALLWNELESHVVVQPWLDLDCAPVRQVQADINELIRRLALQVGDQNLIDAGVATRNDDGILSATPQLQPGVEPLIGLFAAPGATPFDVLLPSGLLLGSEMPAYAIAHDYRIAELLQSSSGLMLLVPTLDDVMICHALGLAAAPITGIEYISTEHLRAVGELLGARPLQLSPSTEQVSSTANAGIENCDVGQGPTNDVQAEDPSTAARGGTDEGNYDCIDWPEASSVMDFVISGWSFVRQQHVPGEQLQRVIGRFEKAQRHLPIDLSGVAVWIPTPNDKECMEFCWELRDRTEFVDAVLESVGRASHILAIAVSGEITAWQTTTTFVDAPPVVAGVAEPALHQGRVGAHCRCL